MIDEAWTPLAKHTTARIGLATRGRSIATRDHLAFQLAHAKARDAVDTLLDVPALVEALRRGNITPVTVRSRAADRRTYLTRPDLGRALDDQSVARLTDLRGSFDIVFVVADGLSAQSATNGAKALLDAALPLFEEQNWTVAPIVVAEGARVALGDEVARALGAELAVIILGERPGLSAPDSLGLYITWKPQAGHSDAARNCISNVRPDGLCFVEAAQKLFRLCVEARRRQATGTGLKDDSEDQPPAAPSGTSNSAT